MGINPSRDQLHLGHYLTMLQAGKALKTSPGAVGMFFVDNREHHHKLQTDGNEDTYRLPGYHATQRVGQLMNDFLARIADELRCKDLPGRVRIQPMSDYMSSRSPANADQTRTGGILYEQLWNYRKEINRLFEFSDTNSMQYVRPFCRDCKTGVRSDDLVRSFCEGILTTCQSEHCPTERIFIQPGRGMMNWSMHYAVDPIRDALLSSQFHDRRVLHVFGGDYGIPWGFDNQPKAQRMSKLMERIRPGMIDHFVGPMLMRDGQKLAKSSGDAHDAPPIAYLNDLLATNEPYIEVAA